MASCNAGNFRGFGALPTSASRGAPSRMIRMRTFKLSSLRFLRQHEVPAREEGTTSGGPLMLLISAG